MLGDCSKGQDGSHLPTEAGGILGAAGQVSWEGAAAAGVGGLGSTLCSWPQLAGSHRKKLSPPSFIFLAGCVLDVPLKGPLKQHKLPQTLLLSQLTCADSQDCLVQLSRDSPDQALAQIHPPRPTLKLL